MATPVLLPRPFWRVTGRCADRHDTIPGDAEWHGHLSYLNATHCATDVTPSTSTRRARWVTTWCGRHSHPRWAVSALHSFHRHPWTVSAGCRRRLTGRSSLRDRAGQGWHRPVMHSYAVRGQRRAQYLEQGLHNARVLAANQRPGDGSHSPWPFAPTIARCRSRAGVRQYDLYPAFVRRAAGARLYRIHGARRALWKWIKHYQIPSAAADGALFAQFFEDHDVPSNRTAWAPLNLARLPVGKTRGHSNRTGAAMPVR